MAASEARRRTAAAAAFCAEDGSEQIIPASEKTTSAGNALKRIWQKRLGP
jgi:hypothetical protein